MEVQTHTVPVRFVNALLATVSGQRGRHVAATLGMDCIRRAGIRPELLENPAARVTLEEFAQVYRLLSRVLDDETLCLFSRPLRGGALKFLCLAMLDAPNLHVALHRFCQFFRLLIDDVHFELHAEGKSASVRLKERQLQPENRVLALELMVMLVQGVASWMADRRIPFIRIDFSYPEPAHATEYAHLYPGPVSFGQGVTALHMDANWLLEPVRRDKEALDAFLRNAPLDWFYVSVGERPYTYRVREYLRLHLASGAGVEEVAHAMHTSPRTLARRLTREGARFQQVKDSLRRDTAIAQLSKTDTPIALIGVQLGFEDTTAFNRAFRQWTGSAPGAYRKRPDGG